MAKSSRKKLAGRVRQAILAQAILPEQIHRGDYELINPAEIDSNMPQTLVPRNKSQWAIERYFNKGLIDERQLEAGRKFRQLYERAGIEQRVTSAYELPTGGREITYGMATTERQAEARQQWRSVADRFPPLIMNLAINGICRDASPTEIGGGSRPEITGMAYIRLCLDVLADHYRL